MHMVMTLTVPDQFTADLFHGTTATPPVPSPTDPNSLATRAEASARACSALVHAGSLLEIPLPALGAALQLSPLLYPAATDANVSIFFQAAPDGYEALQSPTMDSRASALEAVAETAAFELHEAVWRVPALTDSSGVRHAWHLYH